MKVLTRTTAQGNEYWDTVEKKILFVPTDEETYFEVTEDPKSMLTANIDVKKISEEVTKKINEIKNEYEIKSFGDMTIKELHQYAISKEIEIPKDIKKQPELAQYISDNWKPDIE